MRLTLLLHLPLLKIKHCAMEQSQLHIYKEDSVALNQNSLNVGKQVLTKHSQLQLEMQK